MKDGEDQFFGGRVRQNQRAKNLALLATWSKLLFGTALGNIPMSAILQLNQENRHHLLEVPYARTTPENTRDRSTVFPCCHTSIREVDVTIPAHKGQRHPYPTGCALCSPKEASSNKSRPPSLGSYGSKPSILEWPRPSARCDIPNTET